MLISETDGALYRTDSPEWFRQAPLRANYRFPHRVISTVADLKATLRWGGCGRHFVTGDGGRLSFETVRKELRCIIGAIRREDYASGWRVIGTDSSSDYDDPIYDDHTGDLIS